MTDYDFPQVFRTTMDHMRAVVIVYQKRAEHFVVNNDGTSKYYTETGTKYNPHDIVDMLRGNGFCRVREGLTSEEEGW